MVFAHLLIISPRMKITSGGKHLEIKYLNFVVFQVLCPKFRRDKSKDIIIGPKMAKRQAIYRILLWNHHNGVITGAMASQVTSLKIVYSTVCSGADQRKYQNSASLAFVRGIPQWQVNSRHKRPVTRKMFPFDNVLMIYYIAIWFILLGVNLAYSLQRLVWRQCL